MRIGFGSAVMAFFAAVVVAGAAGCVRIEARHKAGGNVLFHNGDFAGAAKEYRAAIAAAPGDANGYTLLGNVLFEQGKLDEAAQSYAAALARDAGAREALRGQATIALRRGDTVGARRLFESLVTSEPRDAEAQSALGKFMLEQGELEGAEMHLRAALSIANNEPGSMYCLGLVLAKKRQRAQAFEVFDRLEAVTPGQPFAPYGRAVAASLDGDREEALKWLATALQRGIEDLDGVVNDPSFAQLASDPRFASLVAAARARASPKKGAPHS